MAQWPRAKGWITLAIASLLALEARGEDCPLPPAQSSCIDASSLWLEPSPTRFISIPTAATRTREIWSLAVNANYASRPIVARATSPDPSGREIVVVDGLLVGSALASARLQQHVQATVVLPFVLHQSGTGIDGLTSQQVEGIQSPTMGDPRVGARFSWLGQPGADGHMAVGGVIHLDIVLPFGDGSAFAGERGVVTAPGFSIDMAGGRWFAASDVGLRLRNPSQLGSTRIGTQLTTSVGVGYEVLGARRLAIAAETWILSTLISQASSVPMGDNRVDGTHAPAEWMLSLRTGAPRAGWSAQLGFGTAIPLSSETRESPTAHPETERFAGLTTPRLRGIVTIRFAAASD